MLNTGYIISTSGEHHLGYFPTVLLYSVALDTYISGTFFHLVNIRSVQLHFK